MRSKEKAWWPAAIRRTTWCGLWLTALLVGCGDCQDSGAAPPSGDYFVPLEPGDYVIVLEPELSAPARYDFGLIERGDSRSKIVQVSNQGRDTLHISRWDVTNPNFSVSFPGFMSGETPRRLEPGEVIEVQIDYTARGREPDTGDLIILSDDPKRGEFRMALTGNVEGPCLTLSAREMDFGLVAPGEDRTMLLTLTSCSEIATTRYTVSPLGDPIDSAFEILDLEDLSEAELPAGNIRDVVVRFAPGEPGEYTNYFEVRSDSRGQETQRVDVVGTGAPYECPSAVISARHEARGVGVTAAPYGEYFGLPLDVLDLSSEESSSPDGASIERVEWSLVRRPADSGAAFSSGATSARNALFLDLSGEYTIELNVWNSRGIKSCEPALLDVSATPDEDIHIQLVWDTPNDDQQFDPFGTDVDLHLLRQGGVWNFDPWDCYWQNLEPDWGASFDRSDNPSLDIDDTDGWGPENINLNNPEQGQLYHVGVHYFSDQGFGLSYATLRLYLGGVLVREIRRQRLSDQQFWHAFDVEWPSQRVTEYNSIYSTFPQGVFNP